MSNKLKIFNDPIYGFINIPHPLILDLIEHPYFQRLRRITQTGLTHLVYPGAVHTRFHHAMGAMHLMQKSLLVLKQKGITITQEEELAACVAILLHDIGHGPFSHALEHSIAEKINHEQISRMMMEQINQEFNQQLDLAIKIFNNQYHKTFLHQLISSQVDVDRLDYLKRDSFYSGVVEGNINSDRIISMMNVADNELVLDEKGIYSIEKFLISRTLMYWQVYLHKTSVAAEIYLIQILKRAKELAITGANVPASKAFSYFLNGKSSKQFNDSDLHVFTQLDDYDVLSAIKEWQNSPDPILSQLCKMIISRKLPAAKILEQPLTPDQIKQYTKQAEQILAINQGNSFVQQTKLKVKPYNSKKNPIKLLSKNKTITLLHQNKRSILMESLTKTTKKYHLCYLDVNKNTKV